MTDYLTLENLLVLAEELHVSHVRDIGLLESAAQRPQTSLYGEEAYPRLFEKAAVLLESITRNHPLIDGNKRLAWVSVVVFLELNGRRLNAPEDDAYDLVIRVATGQEEYQAVADFLEAWSAP